MQGIILYSGPSSIDGKPIVGIATGLTYPSRNIKTGALVQIYIIRSDIHPLKAAESGEDVSICGNCRHRGVIVINPEGKKKNVDRSCYVTLIRGPSVVYRSFLDGAYQPVSVETARKLLSGRMVRVGAYGDPAAVPSRIWDVALDRVRSITGYTHLWREHPELSNFCMASCDTEVERESAKALGFRTFRVRTKDSPILKGEGHCPASDEMRNAVQCISCMLCGGTNRQAKADISIIAHGTGSVNFKENDNVA